MKFNVFDYLRRKTISFWLLLFLIYIPIGSGLLASLSILAYINWPFRDLQIELPNEITATKVIIIAHGVHDDTKSWVSELVELAKQKSDSEVIALDWSQYAKNPLTCSVNAKRIGTKVAESLANFKQIKSVVLVGHSCGAFVLNGFCESFKETSKSTDIHTVYLDPISIYGGLFKNYGKDNFGTCEDSGILYFDKDDNVIGSNEAYPHVNSEDVTQSKKDSDYSGSAHKWPIYYFMTYQWSNYLLAIEQ